MVSRFDVRNLVSHQNLEHFNVHIRSQLLGAVLG